MLFKLIARFIVGLPLIVPLVLAAGSGHAQDAADFVVRLNRLEGQMRQLSGQIEQLQFENRQLKDQLRKFQEDVDFRFQDSAGRTAKPARPSVQPTPGGQTPGRRGDAFDPGQNPGAPGAPRVLGSTTPSAPLPLPGGALGGSAGPGSIGDILDEDAPPAAGGPLNLGAIQRGEPGAPPPPARSGPSVAATGSPDPRADYDSAYAYLLQKEYERAEMGFRGFLQSHPRDKLVPDAVFWLGETYAQRNRQREAAEQFLKVTTDHGRSAKAPDAMLKLGIALMALGAREQACATYAELERKYPQASASVRQGVEREQRRARCAA